MEDAMAKSRDRDVSLSSEQSAPRKSLLFELKGRRTADDESAGMLSTEMFAALSIEEVLAYMRSRQPSVEIVELKVLGKVQVLSNSEHLA
jgi:hypothetical protein